MSYGMPPDYQYDRGTFEVDDAGLPKYTPTHPPAFSVQNTDLPRPVRPFHQSQNVPSAFPRRHQGIHVQDGASISYFTEATPQLCQCTDGATASRATLTSRTPRTSIKLKLQYVFCPAIFPALCVTAHPAAQPVPTGIGSSLYLAQVHPLISLAV